ncbi:MAG: hypothetical protein CMJ31_04645 [Phycisphaerae bacterium]|nr:hypothetical protein [Phycisphaerae bacterium]
MQRKALGVLAVALVVMIVAVLMVGWSGIDRRVRSLAASELANLEQAQRTVESQAATLEGLISDERALFAAEGSDVAWPEAFNEAQASLDELDGGPAATLREILDSNDDKREDEAERLAAQIAATRIAAMAPTAGIVEGAQELVRFKQELDQNIAQIEADHKRAMGASFESVIPIVQRAQADWPEKREDLAQRLDSLSGTRQGVERVWEDIQPLIERAEADNATPKDIRTLADAAATMHTFADELEIAPGRLRSLVEQLYLSWDKVLTDLTINEGVDVSFSMTTTTIYTRATTSTGAGADASDDRSSRPVIRRVTQSSEPSSSPTATNAVSWEGEPQTAPISKQTFEQYKDKIGMVIEHKSAGKYDHEVETGTPQPAGYAYIAPPGESNRYGRWEQRNGTSFWVFYGQYALMRDLFWGPRWSVGRDDYNAYGRARSRNATYYGDAGGGQQRYGSGGSATRSKYAGSQYVSSGGYRNSRYVQSGGTYRGSRYERSTSSGGYRSGGYSRSGSRSSGK